MPLLRNKFQPYFPDPDAPKNEQCGEPYCHPLSLGDIIYSQFRQTPCGISEITDPTFGNVSLGAELLTDTGFPSPSPTWTSAPGGAWTPSGGVNSLAVYDPAFVANTYTQTGLTLTPGNIYRFLITIGGMQGGDSLNVYLGSTAITLSFDTNGIAQEFYIQAGADNTDIVFEAVSANQVTMDNVSLKEVTYTDWIDNASWVLYDGTACHIEGTTGLLEEAVADYITPNEYYELTLTVTGYVAGDCDVYIADDLVGTISANGTFSYYGTPTVTGVISFDPSSDFIGCINFEAIPDADRQTGLYLLNNDHLAYLVGPDGTEYPIGQYFTYWERFVTLVFDITLLELNYDCYTLKVIDACIVSGDNVVYNGSFTGGGTDWTVAAIPGQYSFAGSELSMNFTIPAGIDYIANGDFATGDFTDWTAGANWAVVGNAAVHTPGSTAVLEQTVTLPAYEGPPVSNWYFLQITVSGRTAGSLSFQLGNLTRASYNTNAAMTIGFTEPNPGGAILFSIIPTSDFDGTIDNIQLYRWAGFFGNSVVVASNTMNPLTIAGNYEGSIDIVSNSDSRIAVAVRIEGQSAALAYFNTVGTHTFSIPNYVPGGQRVQVQAVFEEANYGVPGTIVVDNIDVHPVEPFEATYESEYLDYQLEHTDTRMILAYCDQEALGFDFTNTGFVFAQRVNVRSLNPIYPGEMLIQKSGNGDARLTYSDLEKYWLFATDFLSETAHDALAAMVRCDHLFIGLDQSNGKEYLVQPEEYAPTWRAEGDYSLSTVNWYIRIKTGGQVFNRHR